MADNTLNSHVDADDREHKFEEASLLPPFVQRNRASHSRNSVHTSDGRVPEGRAFRSLCVQPRICSGKNYTAVANETIMSCRHDEYSFLKFLTAVVSGKDAMEHNSFFQIRGFSEDHDSFAYEAHCGEKDDNDDEEDKEDEDDRHGKKKRAKCPAAPTIPKEVEEMVFKRAKSAFRSPQKKNQCERFIIHKYNWKSIQDACKGRNAVSTQLIAICDEE